MSKEHKNVLRKHRDELVQNLNPDRVLDILYGADVLTDNDLSTINAVAVRQKQVHSLLDILQRGDDEGFPNRLEALKNTKQNALADLLEMPTGKSRNKYCGTGLNYSRNFNKIYDVKSPSQKTWTLARHFHTSTCAGYIRHEVVDIDTRCPSITLDS